MPQSKKKKIVVVGGGTGTYTLLKGLKRYADQLDITAIVTMADSGGSTGRLRDEFGQLPVGDVRMALAALSADIDSHDELLRELFLYRFSKGAGLSGHNLGNLLLTALTDILGNEASAIEAASRILRVCGRVVPVTADNVNLMATYDDGAVVVGEHAIDEPPASRHARRISTLSLTPAASLNPAAAETIAAADLIVFGPGDLYTSILANCVVDGFATAIQQTPATLAFVCNLMSRLGQTVGMHAAEHVAEITHYIGRQPEHVFINSATFPTDLLQRYHAEGTAVVEHNYTAAASSIHHLDLVCVEPVTPVPGDALRRSLIRHDPDKLAISIISVLD